LIVDRWLIVIVDEGLPVDVIASLLSSLRATSFGDCTEPPYSIDHHRV